MSEAAATNTSEPRWTPAQEAAIRHIDGALLVSAAAGSGKTAVLAARCAYLVCEAPEPCDVDELLVLTFTRAAAAEMRERIDRAIRGRVAQSDDERLLRQLRLIDRAQITTIDAFCGALVRTHFHQVGVDPTFAILAPEDAGLLRNDIGERLIDGEYDSPRAPVFRQLLDGYFSGDDARLRRQMIAAHGLLQSIVEPGNWLEGSIARLRDGASSKDSELLRQFGAIQQRELIAAIRKLDHIIARAHVSDGLAPYAAHAQELAVELRERLALSSEARFDVLAARLNTYEVPKLPRMPRDPPPGKEAMQAEINHVKDAMKKGPLHRLFRWSVAQLQSDLGQIIPLAEYFFDLVQRFGAAYDRGKRDLRALDFADTETLALRILRSDAASLTPSPAAMDLQRRFRHVLVDEYQDINPLQNAILRLVSRDRAAELSADSTRSNFFQVGDVKQSIYRFRLAEPQQFIDRQAALREPAATLGRVIDLQENFRSRAPLLNAVNDVFRLLMTSESSGINYDATQELRSLNDYPAIDEPHFIGKPIELHLLPRELPTTAGGDEGEDDEELDSFEREIALVARRIRELVTEDEQQRHRILEKTEAGSIGRPVRYGDIAVLLRTAKFKSSQVADALRAAGIPVHSDDSTGFFNATEVQDVLAVLRILANGRQDIPLAAVLRSPFSPIEHKADALAAIRIAYPDELYHRAVTRYADEQHDALAAQLRALLEQLAAWRRMFQERPVGESLLRIYDHNHFLTFCRALPDGAQRVANLQELLERGEMFDSFERQGLDRFLAFLEELEVNDQLGRPSLEADSTDVVRVMTVHKSKGLEFPIVIIPDLGKRFNEMSLAEPVLLDRDLGIGMTAVDLRRRIRYPSAASIVIRDHARRQALAEEIRVLYVGLTRAREHLILVGSADAVAMQTWRDDWADHDGALPDDAVQAASTALDWIGPIAAITEARKLGTFDIIDHVDTDDHAAQATGEESPTPDGEGSPWPKLADGNEVTHPHARLAIERLTYHYPHAKATQQRATMRVSDLLKEELPAAPVAVSPGELPTLPWPATFRASDRPKAVDVGTATHRLLQFLDFRRPLTPDDVREQLRELVARRLMSEAETKLVDIDSIAWLGTTDLAAKIRLPETRLIREQPLALAMSMLADGGDEDRVLLRGRVDALLVCPAGLTLIDYKSDRVDAPGVAERAATYAPQMFGYAGALKAITGRVVEQACLVFLRPRRIIGVPLNEGR